MERSRAGKSGFKMKSSALRAGESIMGRFMAMGRSLGNSKTNTRATIDPSKYYVAPKKSSDKKDVKKIDIKELKVPRLKTTDLTKSMVTENSKKSKEFGTDINVDKPKRKYKLY